MLVRDRGLGASTAAMTPDEVTALRFQQAMEAQARAAEAQATAQVQTAQAGAAQSIVGSLSNLAATGFQAFGRHPVTSQSTYGQLMPQAPIYTSARTGTESTLLYLGIAAVLGLVVWKVLKR